MADFMIIHGELKRNEVLYWICSYGGVIVEYGLFGPECDCCRRAGEGMGGMRNRSLLPRRCCRG